MRQKNIWVIDPATITPEIDCFNKIKSIARGQCEYHLPAIADFDSLKSGYSIPMGIILLGSSANVGDGFSWQRELDERMDQFIEDDIPVLGICYGHQAIAANYGAKVKPSEHKKKGFRMVSLEKDSKLNIPQMKVPLISSHFEVVQDVPSEFECWASSSEVSIDGIRHKSRPVWTLQPHPEATQKFLKSADIEIQDGYEPLDLRYGYEIVSKFCKFCEKGS